MQPFRVVYRCKEYSSSHLNFVAYTYKPLGESAYQENTSNKWAIAWHTTRERCITLNVIENAAATQCMRHTRDA